MPRTLNVLFLAAEAEPFVKVGGLGDVAGSLPRALRSLSPEEAGGTKLDLRLVLPLHPVLRAQGFSLRPLARYALERNGLPVEAQALETRLDDMPVYFIAGEPIAATGSVYSADPARDGEKYTFFSLAALELARRLEWPVNILHANDWHAALSVYAIRTTLSEAASVLGLHNLPFMGADVRTELAAYSLPLAATDLPDWAQGLPLPLGLWAADAIVAVSPTYAREVLTPESGCGLQDFLQRRGAALTGILNGLDAHAFDPATDEALTATFTADNLTIRQRNKTALQEMLSLKPEPRTPLLGMVTRMEAQKGIDLALDALRMIAAERWQAVILGVGDAGLEEAARRLQADLPERVRVETRYNGPLARRIYGGADIYLMPSRYEPCGLAQMIAMRYGCVPVVRATGGLKDTVMDGENGFTFEEAAPAALAEALRRALDLYQKRDRWQALQRAGMSRDFSWSRSARQYAELYRTIL